MTRWRPDNSDAEAGSVALAAAIFFPAVLIIGGLVLDGGFTLAARQRAASTAENAARAGAQALDINELRRTGRVQLDQRAAAAAARTYLSQVGDTGTVEVRGTTVTVSVSERQPMTLLRLSGLTTVTVTGRATARAASGITGAAP